MKFSYFLVAILIAFTPFAANAVPFNFTFTGEIKSFRLMSGASSTGHLDVGDSVSGSFTYDGSIVPSRLAFGFDTISDFSITADGSSYTATGPSRARLTEDSTLNSSTLRDSFAAESGPLSGPDQGGLSPVLAQFFLLTESNLSVFQAGISPTLSDFQQLIADDESSSTTNNYIVFTDPLIPVGAPRMMVRFDLTDVTVSTADPAVPLSTPATLPLMAAGLGLLGFIGRRRKG